MPKKLNFPTCVHLIIHSEWLHWYSGQWAGLYSSFPAFASQLILILGLHYFSRSTLDNCGYEGDNCTTFIETQTQEKKERNIKNESKPVKSRHDITTEQNPKCLKIKEMIMRNGFMSKLLPPSGVYAVTLCLILSAIAVFLVARCVLGEIASTGGTVFALMVLVVVALIGGQLVVVIWTILSKLIGFHIQLPALLGMLVVGILLKNIPYNFGQFGRLECYNGSIIDSVNELDDIDEHSSLKRSIDDDLQNMSDETLIRGKRFTYHIENINHVNLIMICHIATQDILVISWTLSYPDHSEQSLLILFSSWLVWNSNQGSYGTWKEWYCGLH